MNIVDSTRTTGRRQRPGAARDSTLNPKKRKAFGTAMGASLDNLLLSSYCCASNCLLGLLFLFHLPPCDPSSPSDFIVVRIGTPLSFFLVYFCCIGLVWFLFSPGQC